MSQIKKVTCQLKSDVFERVARRMGYDVRVVNGMIEVKKSGMYAKATLNKENNQLIYDNHMDERFLGDLVSKTYEEQIKEVAQNNGYTCTTENNSNEMLIHIRR